MLTLLPDLKGCLAADAAIDGHVKVRCCSCPAKVPCAAELLHLAAWLMLCAELGAGYWIEAHEASCVSCRAG